MLIPLQQLRGPPNQMPELPRQSPPRRERLCPGMPNRQICGFRPLHKLPEPLHKMHFQQPMSIVHSFSRLLSSSATVSGFRKLSSGVREIQFRQHLHSDHQQVWSVHRRDLLLEVQDRDHSQYSKEIVCLNLPRRTVYEGRRHCVNVSGVLK